MKGRIILSIHLQWSTFGFISHLWSAASKSGLCVWWDLPNDLIWAPPLNANVATLETQTKTVLFASTHQTSPKSHQTLQRSIISYFLPAPTQNLSSPLQPEGTEKIRGVASSCRGRLQESAAAAWLTELPVPASLICLGTPVSYLGPQMVQVWASKPDSCLGQPTPMELCRFHEGASCYDRLMWLKTSHLFSVIDWGRLV